jgi:hypothetical protein
MAGVASGADAWKIFKSITFSREAGSSYIWCTKCEQSGFHPAFPRCFEAVWTRIRPSAAFNRRTPDESSSGEQKATSGPRSKASAQRYRSKIPDRIVLMYRVCQRERIADLAFPKVPPNDHLAFRTGEFSLFVILRMRTPEQQCHGNLESDITSFRSLTWLRFARAVLEAAKLRARACTG